MAPVSTIPIRRRTSNTSSSTTRVSSVPRSSRSAAHAEPMRAVDEGRADRRIAVLISGRGSNLQAILDAIAQGMLDATVAVVLSNRAAAAGLSRARDAGIETL